MPERHRHPICPTHGTRLLCPKCIRAVPRRPLTEEERERKRAAMAQARAKRWPAKAPS